MNLITKSIFATCILLLAITFSQAQVGIGTITPNASAQLDVNSSGKGFLPPRMTIAQRSAIVSPAVGLMVYQTDANPGNYIYNGITWVLLSNVNYGDIKTGIQSTDHNGWIKLDGRLKSSLSTTQQAQATTLGIGANLPNATNAYLVQNGGTLGTVSGNNTKTIGQSNLPNVTLGGTTVTSGAHTHTIPVGFSTMTVAWNTYAGNVGYVTQGSSTTSSDPGHTHTLTTSSLNGGVSQTSFDVTPQSLSVNTFIYLGN